MEFIEPIDIALLMKERSANRIGKLPAAFMALADDLTKNEMIVLVPPDDTGLMDEGLMFVVVGEYIWGRMAVVWGEDGLIRVILRKRIDDDGDEFSAEMNSDVNDLSMRIKSWVMGDAS